MPDERRLRDEICRVGASLHSRGYTAGTSGNLSARLDDGWLITPTDACFGTLDPGSLAKVASNGNWISGDRPSKTLSLHRNVYETDRSVGAVLHTHSTHLVALSLAGVWREDDVLPPITPYYVMKVGHVPLLRYRRPGDPSVADEMRSLANRVRAVLLDRLGPVVWAEGPAEAGAVLEELEETARLWLMTTPRPEPLPEHAIEDLRRAFGASW